jgi:hypothetical protein
MANRTDDRDKAATKAESWTTITARITARFDISSKFDLRAVHDAAGSEAISGLMKEMATNLDKSIVIIRELEEKALVDRRTLLAAADEIIRLRKALAERDGFHSTSVDDDGSRPPS